jgi:2-dehydro-3-deoxyglucarate aldolase
MNFSIKGTSGTWIQIPSLELLEIFCHTNLDWICFDIEHGMITDDYLRAAVPIVSANNKKVAVRVLQHDPFQIRRYLDLGVDIIILPNVSDPIELISLKKYFYYPPKGCRGIGFSRSNKYGADLVEQLKFEPIVIGQIESIEGINRLDQILNEGFLSGVMLGPYDLSGSLNVCGRFDSPVYQNAVRLFIETARMHNIPAGQHIVKIQQLEHEVADNFDFVALGLDTDFVSQAARRIDEVLLGLAK